MFNYINEVRVSEGRVDDNVILPAVSTSSTAQLSAQRKQRDAIVHSQHLLSVRAGYPLPPSPRMLWNILL